MGGTGLVYAWMRYFATPVDEFSIVNHPWQPLVQHLHVWTAPALVFACGYLWHEHAWRYWRDNVRAGRRTGIGLILSCAPMIVSGYLIQTSVTPAWRQAWIVVHVAASLLFLAAYVPHQWGCKHSRADRRAARRSSGVHRWRRGDAAAKAP